MNTYRVKQYSTNTIVSRFVVQVMSTQYSSEVQISLLECTERYSQELSIIYDKVSSFQTFVDSDSACFFFVTYQVIEVKMLQVTHVNYDDDIRAVVTIVFMFKQVLDVLQLFEE
jgi:hypothetical protein